jgi:hypothetical protein
VIRAATVTVVCQSPERGRQPPERNHRGLTPPAQIGFYVTVAARLAEESVDFPAIRVYATSIGNRGIVIVFHARALLMILIAVRLLMPPGICACKWSSPAARLLIALTQSDRQIPSEQERDGDDDHDAGCPASPLAAGMGVKPPCEPLLPPGLALDPPPPLQSTMPFFPLHTEPVASVHFDDSSTPLYLTSRALLL